MKGNPMKEKVRDGRKLIRKERRLGSKEKIGLRKIRHMYV
jgi:hypothetical protein